MATRFRDRLAYARWRYHLIHGVYPGNAEIGRALDVTGPWVTKWAARDDAPDSRTLGRALSAFLECPEAWLMDDEGEAPDPDLWMRWEFARGRPVLGTRNAAYTGPERRLEDVMAEQHPSPLPDASEPISAPKRRRVNGR